MFCAGSNGDFCIITIGDNMWNNLTWIVLLIVVCTVTCLPTDRRTSHPNYPGQDPTSHDNHTQNKEVISVRITSSIAVNRGRVRMRSRAPINETSAAASEKIELTELPPLAGANMEFIKQLNSKKAKKNITEDSVFDESNDSIVNSEVPLARSADLSGPRLTTVSFSIVHDTKNEKPHTPKVYSQPAKVYSEPAKVYSQPAKVYSEPAKFYSEPAKVYGEPAKVYGIPSKFYSKPASLDIDREPNKLWSPETPTTTVPTETTKATEQNEKNYEVDEMENVNTDGRSHGVQDGENCKHENCKVGYVVEGRQYRKYRVEERTADGFIVGEYGVVRNEDGALRGVRYTADSEASPRLIYDALMKFLQL